MTLPQPTRLNVEITSEDDGGVVVVPADSANGWTLDDVNAPTKVLLHGASCTDFEGAETPRIQLVVGCFTLLPPGC